METSPLVDFQKICKTESRLLVEETNKTTTTNKTNKHLYRKQHASVILSGSSDVGVRGWYM